MTIREDCTPGPSKGRKPKDIGLGTSDFRLVALTQGQFAKVSEEDFERVAEWMWHAEWNSKTRSYYAVRRGPSPGRVKISMHRFILGNPVAPHIDHQDGDTLNNQRSNIREATAAQNARNRGATRANKVGIKGVCQYGQKWGAFITVDYKSISLGRFDSKEEAGKAYQIAAAKYHGEFARNAV